MEEDCTFEEDCALEEDCTLEDDCTLEEDCTFDEDPILEEDVFDDLLDDDDDCCKSLSALADEGKAVATSEEILVGNPATKDVTMTLGSSDGRGDFVAIMSVASPDRETAVGDIVVELESSASLGSVESEEGTGLLVTELKVGGVDKMLDPTAKVAVIELSLGLEVGESEGAKVGVAAGGLNGALVLEGSQLEGGLSDKSQIPCRI